MPPNNSEDTFSHSEAPLNSFKLPLNSSKVPPNSTEATLNHSESHNRHLATKYHAIVAVKCSQSGKSNRNDLHGSKNI